MKTIDEIRLREVVRQNVEFLCRYFFPAVQKHGKEFWLADVGGAKGRSLRIALDKAGVWFDHATGQGGDFIELLRVSRSLSFRAAAESIGAALGIDLSVPNTNHRH